MGDLKQRRSRPSFEEAWRQRFIKFADNDDDAGIAGWSASGLEARYRHFTRVWPGDADGNLWLDVGCGAGTYTRFLAGRGMRVIGMDYSRPTLIKARERAGGEGAWVVADVTRMPLGGGTFDGILCFGVMQALERSEPAVQELVRAVRPGGQVWIDALNGRCLPSLWERLARRVRGRRSHLRYDSPRRLSSAMVAAGCSNVRVYWVPILPAHMQRYQGLFETPLAQMLLRRVPFAAAALCHAFVVRARRAGDGPPRKIDRPFN